MQAEFETERLLIDSLDNKDTDFIFELLNSKGWLEFIGDRHIHSREDALSYIKKIHDNPNFHYWVIRLKNNLTPIGVVSLIKRDYLANHDIGFALLPQFKGFGFAFEATNKILLSIIRQPEHSTILATALPQNIDSIKLLQKLRLHFVEEIQVEKETLHVYSVERLDLNDSKTLH